jgi:hypothetical protein
MGLLAPLMPLDHGHPILPGAAQGRQRYKPLKGTPAIAETMEEAVQYLGTDQH